MRNSLREQLGSEQTHTIASGHQEVVRTAQQQRMPLAVASAGQGQSSTSGSTQVAATQSTHKAKSTEATKHRDQQKDKAKSVRKIKGGQSRSDANDGPGVVKASCATAPVARTGESGADTWSSGSTESEHVRADIVKGPCLQQSQQSKRSGHADPCTYKHMTTAAIMMGIGDGDDSSIGSDQAFLCSFSVLPFINCPV